MANGVAIYRVSSGGFVLESSAEIEHQGVTGRVYRIYDDAGSRISELRPRAEQEADQRLEFTYLISAGALYESCVRSNDGGFEPVLRSRSLVMRELHPVDLDDPTVPEVLRSAIVGSSSP